MDKQFNGFELFIWCVPVMLLFGVLALIGSFRSREFVAFSIEVFETIGGMLS